MKNRILRASMLCSLLVIGMGMSSRTAGAQTARQIAVDIPFEFVVGQQSLPPGAYTVRRAVRDSDRLLLIESRDRTRTVTIMTNPVTTRDEQKTSRLNFRKLGDQYFFSQIWTTGSRAGREVGKSPLERSLERELSERRGADGSSAAQQKSPARMPVTIVSVNGRLP